MTPEEYNKRILKTVADVRTLLDCFAEENILPSQTLEHTAVARRAFKREVVRVLFVHYAPKTAERR